MDDITLMMNNNEEKLNVVKNFRKYLQAVYSVEESIETKLLSQKEELEKIRDKQNENRSYFKRIRVNLLD